MRNRNADAPTSACIGCGCVDAHACAGGCSWLALDRHKGEGVCSRCPDELPKFKVRFRVVANQYSGRGEQRIGEVLGVYTANRLVGSAVREAPGLFAVRLPELLWENPDPRAEFKARLREGFVNEELVDLVVAKLAEIEA